MIKKITSHTLIVLLLLFAACKGNPRYGEPNTNGETLENDFKQWWTYYKKNINLSSDFVGIDDTEKQRSKADFLKILTSGEYIPLKLAAKDSLFYYKLFKLNPNANKDIKNAMKQSATIYLDHFKKEGTPFPSFQLTDMKGTTYNNENTKGKIVILKCWFIQCRSCVAEFPELNELVDNYRNREDMLFISIATDTKNQLERFLTEKKFNYQVVPEQEDFMRGTLGVTSCPTHFIIDKNGIIQKVTNSAEEMIPKLRALASAK
jgi:Peroxiredoxin